MKNNVREMSGWTYEKAGVDREKETEAVSKIWKLISKTFKYRKGKLGQPLDVKGHYAGIIDIGAEHHIALHVDNVGTKVLVAQRMEKYDTVGIDLVAMNANDLISIGAEPIALVDYIAIKEPSEELISEIMKGIVEGAKQSGMVVLGGESATVPELIMGVSKNAFDLAGMSMGIVKQAEIITGEAIQAGDRIFGLVSNGIHSNGLTLARKLFFDVEGMQMNDPIEGNDTTVGEELLRPTKIYVPEVMDILEKCQEIHGIAHITGGAYTKLHRLRRKDLEFELCMPNPPAIFLTLQDIGKISTREMYRTYNMGVGLVLVADKREEETIKTICTRHGTKCYTLGRVKKGEGITVKAWNGETISF
ncbi:MAG: phosphoribosylformylglycinamidine cyclo-ligase [Candidatus Korarchaeota archaeon]|nr:phosphoribosylformylglycinamidine cyclo-ligase [Candidatus Korarchaeota archaeon]NIU85042.1 phosphoribosylformylglycinamidine cyclo-ligase [Candidatus Thorarchaeota archaeon]NIW15067.1 phosphoribosylformylglycinamidine cyclo-ligase [Candidatus Thorarchaeota archaeon]NIW53077.1 phosphoribosylformylglycinamidine cyclo-ligase [Candidatus Korarchaeota archaeon]